MTERPPEPGAWGVLIDEAHDFELLPYQREIMDRILRGDRMVLMVPRRGGVWSLARALEAKLRPRPTAHRTEPAVTIEVDDQ